jgi:hypothetical protein
VNASLLQPQKNRLWKNPIMAVSLPSIFRIYLSNGPFEKISISSPINNPPFFTKNLLQKPFNFYQLRFWRETKMAKQMNLALPLY